MKIKHIEFVEFIAEERIAEKVQTLAAQISSDYAGKTPVFLPVLNGSFIFAGDLIRQVSIPSKVSFVKISSYVGTQSTGQLKTVLGLEESLFNQHVIVVEDIVDTGLTLEKIVGELTSLGTRSVETVALIRKETAREKAIPVKYVGFDIGSEFVLGYGLDYDGLGRNNRNIYKAVR